MSIDILGASAQSFGPRKEAPTAPPVVLGGALQTRPFKPGTVQAKAESDEAWRVPSLPQT